MGNIIFQEASISDINEMKRSISDAIYPMNLDFSRIMVESALLPFYKDICLLAVTDLRLPTGDGYNLLGGSDFAVILDGTSEPVYQANEKGMFHLTPETASSYIRFFFDHVEMEDDGCVVVEHIDDFDWLPSAQESEIKTVENNLKPLTFKEVDGDGLMVVKGTILCQGNLYRSEFRVAPKRIQSRAIEPGKTIEVNMGGFWLMNQELLLEDLPIVIEPVDDGEEIERYVEEVLDYSVKQELAVYEKLPCLDMINYKEVSLEQWMPIQASLPKGLFPDTFDKTPPQVQSADLPFYPGVTLYGITDHSVESPNVMILLRMPEPDGAFILMNYSNEPLYFINDRLPIILAPWTMISYVKMFFFLVRGILGRFVIVEKPDDIEWLPNATDKEKKHVEKALMPVTYLGIDRDGFHTFKVTVIFKNGLFSTEIKIASREMDWFCPEMGSYEHYTIGQMKLVNEDLLFENLNVIIHERDALAD